MDRWLSQLWSRRSKTFAEHPVIGIEEGVRESEDVSDAVSAERRFIARQPILDRKKRIFGYELLARSGWENRFTGDSDDATRKMISDGTLYGFEALTFGRPAFINCTRESLLGGQVTLLPKTAVLEVLETVVPDAEIVNACRSLRDAGYRIALDDFRFSPDSNPLIEFADYIKVDFRLSDAAERASLSAYLRGRKVKLVAEKIETEEEFDTAVSEGYELFQGYFFCQPVVFSMQCPPTSGRNYFPLLAALSRPNCDFGKIADLLKSEPKICYQLLCLVNSVSYSLPARVESLQQALMLVGEDQFRKIVLSAIAVDASNKGPRETLVRALHRARFMELMAPFTRQNPQEQYLYGLLTLLDVLLQVPASSLIGDLPLRPEVKDALNGKLNEVGTAQRLLSLYDQGAWIESSKICQQLSLSEEKLTNIYTDSLQWAERASSFEADSVH